MKTVESCLQFEIMIKKLRKFQDLKPKDENLCLGDLDSRMVLGELFQLLSYFLFACVVLALFFRCKELTKENKQILLIGEQRIM